MAEISLIYIYISTTYYKDPELENEFGQAFVDYKTNTPAFIPVFKCPSIPFPSLKLPKFNFSFFKKQKAEDDPVLEEYDETETEQVKEQIEETPRRSARPRKVRVKKSE